MYGAARRALYLVSILTPLFLSFQGNFVQTMQYGGHWYGLSREAIEGVAREGLACCVHMELEVEYGTDAYGFVRDSPGKRFCWTSHEDKNEKFLILLKLLKVSFGEKFPKTFPKPPKKGKA